MRSSLVEGHTSFECRSLRNLAVWDLMHDNDHFTFFRPSDKEIEDLEKLHSEYGCTWLVEDGDYTYSARQFKIAIETLGTMYPNWHFFRRKVDRERKLEVIFYSEQDDAVIGVRVQGIELKKLHNHAHELTKSL